VNGQIGGGAAFDLPSGAKTTREAKGELMSDNLPRMPTQADIAARAYQIYERRKWEHGYDISDWVLAEQELQQEYQQSLKSVSVLAPRPEEKRKTQSA
jgi:hypothetical protein